MNKISKVKEEESELFIKSCGLSQEEDKLSCCFLTAVQRNRVSKTK